MNYGLIFAGGVGSRMNTKALPKQFLEIHGKPIIIHTIEHFENNSNIDGICVVCVADWIDYLKNLLSRFGIKKTKWVLSGGATSSESQYIGLKAIAESVDYSKDDIVLIHDGVRPMITSDLIDRCINGVKQYGSAISVAPATETIIRSTEDGIIQDTIIRSECQLARAPQSFYVKDILEAHDVAKSEGIDNFIDSTSLLLHYGKQLHIVECGPENIKVTTPSDFYICRALLDARENSQLYGL